MSKTNKTKNPTTRTGTGTAGAGTGTKKKHSKPRSVVEVFSLIPGSKYVKKAFRSAKEKIHKSKFAQKHLIVDPNKNELSKVGKFIKRHIE